MLQKSFFPQVPFRLHWWNSSPCSPGAIAVHEFLHQQPFLWFSRNGFRGVSKGEIIWFVLSHSFSLVHMWYKRKAPLNLLRIHKTQTCYSTYRNQTNWPHVNTKNFGCWRLIEAQTCSRWRWYSISGSPFGSLPFRPVFTYFCLTSFGLSSMFHFIAGRTATRTNPWGPTPNSTKWTNNVPVNFDKL